MFSKACEYAIRATLFVANQSAQGKRAGLKDIAYYTDSPVAYTAKILQQLAKNKILISTKGPSGGFEIDKSSLKSLTLAQIVTAIDGDKIYNGCGLGLSECNAAMPCPVHEHFVAIRNELKIMLETTSLNDLIKGLKTGQAVLKR